MDPIELKRKLRRLKKLEIRIRFGGIDAPKERLVWNEFFGAKGGNGIPAKYGMEKLMGMDRQSLKDVLDEYFYSVYVRFYKENGIPAGGMFDPDLLSKLGLPAGSSEDDVKKRFRELAKKHHPDLGGDSGEFIELLCTYRKLTGDNKS
jgi:hypothetical protein